MTNHTTVIIATQ